MAYMNQEKKARLAPQIKDICKKHGIKATLSVNNHMTLCLNISSGKINFDNTWSGQVNPYWYQDHYKDNPKALSFLSEVIPAMNVGNHDNSDIQSDYFDVGWYISVNIGKYDKPYKLDNS